MPGDDSTLVTGINDRGQVVGTSMNVDLEDELFGVPVVWTVRGARSVRWPDLATWTSRSRSTIADGSSVAT